MSYSKAQINEQLAAIEQEEQVRILYACESGSRAWGFPSKDSDYDVRFIYVRPMDEYLSIDERRDVIERPISSMLDISGWDLRKALKLFRKSNPPLLEWLQSPILYMEQTTAAERIRGLSPLAFSPRSCLYHYLHMARGNYRVYLQGDRVRMKKYFYVLRLILACRWIERTGTMPPMDFQTLAAAMIPENSELRLTIDRLLARKIAGDELDYEPRLAVLNDYLEAQIAYFEEAAVSIPAAQPAQGSELDRIFRSAIYEAWER
ncbi:nucleotidyltransferase domain-containing protein [Paenibacillus sp. R14(2021)]|uniref:nucleotidyltransferase domain-containing protein n=1 Tax=Paenibacillus sp. R14(2021) TaxID=2859228 RepID=UPI0021572483|nr:nucleotidyltransferase domain-containing protein [Paenibacillus sp. R14(2021)]